MNAVLIVVIFVVSIFNVQLGIPIYNFIPMTTMAECERILPHFTSDKDMDIEWKIHTRSQCLTIEEYNRKAATWQRNP